MLRKLIAATAMAGIALVGVAEAASASTLGGKNNRPHASTKPERPYMGKPRFVTVKPGQTLWRLAVIYRGNGHEWHVIADLNGIQGTTIYAGQRLRVS